MQPTGNIEVFVTDEYTRWFRSLKDRLARAAINKRIGRLRSGNFGDHKPVGHAVFELRVDIGQGYRIYATRRGQAIVILLCGGNKSTQSRDIDRARRLAAELESSR